MGTHRLFVANGQFDRFSSSPAWGPRAPLVARMIRDQRADCASIGEMSKAMAAGLNAALVDLDQDDWTWDRTQGSASPGRPGEGLNTVWSRGRAFDQPEARLHDWNMPSGGQWQRTLLLARLEEIDDPGSFVSVATFHCPAAGPGLSRARADDVKLAYVKAMVEHVGDRRVILAGDFARTDSLDDLAWVKAQGYHVAYRDSATPMAVLTRGAVHVTKTTRISHGRAFDHDAVLVEFTIPNTPKDPA